MDALGAFSHLQTNLPAWITRVSELASHTSAKHAEYAEAYRRHAAFKPRRRKNSSVCSIHTDDLVPIAQQKGPSAADVEAVTTSTKDKDHRTPSQQAGRKRGLEDPPSIESTDRNAFVSTRHNVIIEYDGHTQQVLEEVVRNIGFARNHIRRSKMSMLPRTGLRSGLLNRTAALTNRSITAGSDSSQPAALSCVRSTRTGGNLVGVSGSSSPRKESPFDFADKQLELAHGLCETAAYEVLRSGDCGTELDGVEEKFKMLLEMANGEVTRLTEEKKQQEEEKKQQSEQQPEAAEEEAPAQAPLTSSAARLARISAITSSKPSTAATSGGAIEVDDASSASAESIDLSAFRSSRNRV